MLYKGINNKTPFGVVKHSVPWKYRSHKNESQMSSRQLGGRMSGVKEDMPDPLENNVSHWSAGHLLHPCTCRGISPGFRSCLGPPPSSMYLLWHQSRIPKLSGAGLMQGRCTPALEEMGNYRHFNAFTIQYFLVAFDYNHVQKRSPSLMYFSC